MPITIGSLQFVHSGGAGNNDQMQSLGGVISTDSQKKVISQTASTPTLITGVTILDAMGNNPGNGTLTYTSSTQSLVWKGFGTPTAEGLVITGNGVYTIGSTSGYLVVNVVQASLPGSTQNETITIAHAVNKTFDNVSAQQSLVGLTEYRCFYIQNTADSGVANNVTLWIKAQPVGDDTLAIALDPAGKNGTAIGPLSNESDGTNLLTGLTFTAPSSQGTGLLVATALSPGEYQAFWIRRVVPADTTTQVINNFSSLGLSALI